MARPPAGPIGNSPRDVRDDAIGVPPDVIEAGEPPRWPPKRKKVTSNTFHAKVSGGTSGKRADRSPHFRKGGFVKGYKKGGFVASPRSEDVVEHKRAKSQVADLIDQKREDLPGVQKNDTSSDQNLSGKPVKFEDKPIFQPSDMRRKAKLQGGGMVAQGKRLSGVPGPPSDVGKKKQNVPIYQGGGGVKKKLADGGEIKKRQEGGSIGADLQAARDRGTVEARKIMRGAPLRSESTERAKALSRADQDLTNRVAGGRGMPREEREGILRTFKETGDYKCGGAVKK